MIGKTFLSRFGVWLLLFSMIEGCSNNSSSPCKNHREGKPALFQEDATFDTYRIGLIKVLEVDNVGTDPLHDTAVHADFTDNIDYTVQLAPREDYSSSCFIYTGLRVDSGTQQTLYANSVTINGLQTDNLTLTKNGNGTFSPEFLDGRAYTNSPVSFIVESDNGDSDFPSFTDQVAPLDFPILTRVGDLKSLDLSSSPSLGISVDRLDPLSIQWESSDATYVEFILSPGAGTETKWIYLRCIAFDDGCLEVPAEALNYLAPDKCTNFNFTFARHNFKYQQVGADNKKAVVLIDSSSALKAIVFR